MHKKFGINRTKIKGSCQLGKKVGTHNSKSDLPLGLAVIAITFANMYQPKLVISIDFFEHDFSTVSNLYFKEFWTSKFNL